MAQITLTNAYGTFVSSGEVRVEQDRREIRTGVPQSIQYAISELKYYITLDAPIKCTHCASPANVFMKPNRHESVTEVYRRKPWQKQIRKDHGSQ